MSSSSSNPPSSSTPPEKKKNLRIQFSSNLTREPGGHYHKKVTNFNRGKTAETDCTDGQYNKKITNHDTGATKEFEKPDPYTSSSITTFRKNPKTVTTNGRTQSWGDWCKSKTSSTGHKDVSLE